jgi:hypothetical protein
MYAAADVEHFGFQSLPPREGQKLGGQFRGAVDGIRNRVDIAHPPLLGEMRSPQQVDRGADHRQEIVEIVRHAAGQLAQRFQPLAVLERLFGFQSPGGFGMETARSPQRHCQDQKQQRGRGHTENQMLTHGGQPARPDRRCLEPGADINRILG